jgi:hypothetical protein
MVVTLEDMKKISKCDKLLVGRVYVKCIQNGIKIGVSIRRQQSPQATESALPPPPVNYAQQPNNKRHKIENTISDSTAAGSNSSKNGE